MIICCYLFVSTSSCVLYCACHSVKEFMDFTSKILVERTGVTQRSSVKEQGKVDKEKTSIIFAKCLI